jgi:mannobiose 2-epimerase
LSNNREVRNDAPRSAVLYGRILWTFSCAYRLFEDPAYLEMAQRAYDYIGNHLFDPEYGGVYWSVDKRGQALDNRKHSYAQAFTIYGLTEYCRAISHTAFSSAESLERAKGLFRFLETYTYDRQNGGYVEGCSRQWGGLSDMRLSHKEPNCRKTMNTLLHIMEAYTNLMRVWDNPELRMRQKELIKNVLRHVVSQDKTHFDLFFEDDWRTLHEHNHISYGHDIEGSWLLIEAAEVLGDPMLIAETKETAQRMAQAVYDEGRDAEGALLNRRSPHGVDDDHDWWPQAEAVVGFYNMYELTGQKHFALASQQAWNYIEQHFIDRQFGEWYKLVRWNGRPELNYVKTGPWECPYHNSRMGFEMLRRLAPTSPNE